MKKIQWLADTIKWITNLTDRKLNIVIMVSLAAAIVFLYRENRYAAISKDAAANECDKRVEAIKATYSDMIVPVLNKMTKEDQYQVRQIDSLKSELQKLVMKTNSEIKKFKR